LVVRPEGIDVVAIQVEDAENPLAIQQRHDNLRSYRRTTRDVARILTDIGKDDRSTLPSG
jgi:hypothetical protein